VTTLSTLLAASLGAIALAIGAATGRRGLARGVTVAFAFASCLLSALSGLVKGLRPFRPLSLYWHTLGTELIFNGFPVAHMWIVLLVIAVALLLAAVAFERRDLAV
jgi:ABC-2 type transport system permease protein